MFQTFARTNVKDQCQEHIVDDLARPWPRPGEFDTLPTKGCGSSCCPTRRYWLWFCNQKIIRFQDVAIRGLLNLSISQQRTIKGTRKSIGKWLRRVWSFVGHRSSKYMEKNSPKARSNYSASFWVCNLSISFLERPKTPHVHGFRISWHVHESQNQYYLSLGSPGYPK